MTNDEFNQLADGSWKYEIETLRSRASELESVKSICPMCALQIDKAAGVDLVGLNQQPTDCEKERDRAYCTVIQYQRNPDITAAIEKQKKDADLYYDVQNYMTDRLMEIGEQLAAVTKERDDFKNLAMSRMNANCRIQERLATCESALNGEQEARKCADKAVNDYRDLYLASQLRERQLREALEAIESDKCCAPFLKAREALSITNDTSVLDALVNDAERYRWLREQKWDKKGAVCWSDVGCDMDSAIDAARGK